LKAALATARAEAADLRAQLPPARGAQLMDRGYVRFAGKALWLGVFARGASPVDASK